jgi:glycosyltransferase involved in cell wall biosynthesis
VKIALYDLLCTVTAGGIQSTIWELSRELCHRGHTVHLYGGAGPIREEVQGEFTVHTFPFIPRGRFPDLGTRFRAFCERLSFARHALGALSTGRYDVIFIRKPYDMPAALWAKRRSGCRVVFKSGGTEFYPGYRALAKRLDGFLACSRSNAEQIRARTGLLPEVHYNGVNPALFRPLPRDEELAAELGLSPGDFVAVSAVRLVGWKGIQVAVQAMQTLQVGGRFRYLVVGDGDYRQTLEKQVRDLGLTSVVKIQGSVPRREIPRYYSVAGAAVFPSIGDDAFPNSVVEAMASGVPVVATTSGGMTESVVDGETGFLVPPRDSGAIAGALAALAKDVARAREMGMRGRQRAVERFDWARLTDELLAVFERPPARGVDTRSRLRGIR